MDHRRHIVEWGKGHPRHRTTEGNWKKPLAWNRQVEKTGLRRVFCASLSDIFDAEVDQSWRDDLWQVIEATPSLEWLILTKRPENILLMIPPRWKENPPKNIMMGTSVRDQATADEFIPRLLNIGHLFRCFVSIEPMIGPIDLGYLDPCDHPRRSHADVGCWRMLKWVIVGGESGPDARPMHPDWVRSIRAQCRDAGIPFHFKQWGEWAPSEFYEQSLQAEGDYKGKMPDYTNFMDWERANKDMQYFKENENNPIVFRVGKKAAGRLLDGVEWNEYPEEMQP
jgi:protein gp37